MSLRCCCPGRCDERDDPSGYLRAPPPILLVTNEKEGSRTMSYEYYATHDYDDN